MTADLHALSGAYVLDAVDDIERAAFTRHLAECEACRAEVAELREVAARLGGAAGEQQPPAGMRDSVLAAVRHTRQLPPEVGGARRRDRADLPGTRAERNWRRATVAAVAAAAVAVVGVWGVMDQRVRDERRQVQVLQADRDRIYDVMNARDVRMRGADMPGGGRLAAAVSDSQHAGVAMFAGLPTPPAGETYQMWLITGGDAASALVLPVGTLGGTALFGWTPGADTFGITVEPAGGSAKPTMQPLTTIALS